MTLEGEADDLAHVDISLQPSPLTLSTTTSMQGPKTVTALSLLSMDPSPTVAASAQQAARTKHGLVNVTRLVRALERMDQEEEDMSWLEVQKTWEVSCLDSDHS